MMTRAGILKTPGRKRLESNSGPKDGIEVFCRVRPIRDSEETCAEILSETTVQLNAPKNSKNSSKVEQVTCTFNKVFDEDVQQKPVFERVGFPLVQDLVSGKNALCFMYGITGSGKTHTMNGTSSDGGILPRCLDSIFNSIQAVQAPRCVFKPNGYNGFEVVGEEDAKCEAEQKVAEMKVLQRNVETYDSERVGDFTTLDVEEDNNYAIFISFVEIYNNSVFDLLEDVTLDTFKQPKAPTSKILREDKKHAMYVHAVSEIEVKNTEEAFTLFSLGQHRRKTALTLMNAESSRSHCVFTIKLVQAPLGPNGVTLLKDPNFVGVSQLSLCDLAGSERMSRTKTDGDRVRQAGHINNSLMTLRTCIEYLRENQKALEGAGSSKMVPYRDSKLTHLFKNYFDGDGKVNMIVCLNPRGDDFDESLHVMRFAEMTAEVKVTRSEATKFETGLTPGRVKAAKLLKLQREDSSSDNTSVEGLLPQVQMFAPWPLHQLASCNDHLTFLNFMDYLDDRMKLRKTLIDDWKEKQSEVRQLIIQLEQDNVDLTKALEEQRVVLNDKEREAKTYEKRIKLLTDKHDALQRSTQGFESQKRQLTADLEKQKEAVHKERQEKQRLKQTLKDLTSNERLRWEKECEKRVLEKEKIMEHEVLKRNEKLNQLRTVVAGISLQLPEENQRRLTQMLTDSPAKVNKGATGSEAKHCGCVCKPSSDTEQKPTTKQCACFADNKPRTKPKPKEPKTPHGKPHIRTAGVSSNSPRKPMTKYRSRSPPPTMPSKVRSRSPPPDRKNDVAPVRSGKHRRSRSTDFWLNHKPSDTLETTSVFQPVITNKKTVKKLTPKDVKAFPNYVLSHQSEDSSGELVDKLIKGVVSTTRGGGASVEFTDIETLKKTMDGGVVPEKKEKSNKENRTPKTTRDRKRRAESETEDSSNAEESLCYTDVEQRCAVGIEHRPGAEPGLVHHTKKLKS